MLSTPDGDSAGPHHRYRHRGRRAPSTTPARTLHRRRHAATRSLTGRTGFSSRPTTLWPFAEADPLPGTAQLAGWLGRVIVTLVTGYTRPGDRVLLLNPPAPARRPSTRRGTRGPDPYAGLTEALWTVIRLGRGAYTATAAPGPDRPQAAAGAGRRLAVESASGLRLQQSDRRTPADDSADDDHESDSPSMRAEYRAGDRFDLIITAVHPHDTDWLAHTDWTTILTPTGIIAAITHSDASDSLLVDPIATIAGTFRSRGWRWLDHIAVLTEHLHAPTNTTTATTPVAVPTAVRAAAPAVECLPIRSVHHDLLLFVPAPSEDHAHTAVYGEASDE